MAKAAKSIAILGAGGSMGTWFSKYFIALKYSVTGFDSENAIKVKGVIGANSLVGAILTADYVLLCTPARKTPEIIRLIAKEMKRDAYLVDISSQKSKTSSSLAKIPAKINHSQRYRKNQILHEIRIYLSSTRDMAAIFFLDVATFEFVPKRSLHALM